MYGWRAKIAYMLPSSCTVFEQEFLKVTAGLDGVIGCPTRLLIDGTDADGMAQMNEGIDLAARQLATTAPDVLVYMCTAGSFAGGQAGNQAIKDRLRTITGCPQVATTSEAVVEALKGLGVRRVAMLTPYDDDVTGREVDFLGYHEIAVTDFTNLDIEDNLDRGSVTPEQSFRSATALDHQGADGLFLSCGNIRSIEIIASLEAHTDRPVVTSAQATIWKALRLAGVTEPIDGYGSLLRDH